MKRRTKTILFVALATIAVLMVVGIMSLLSIPMKG